MKWLNFTPHQKNTRIKMVIFFIGLTTILIYTMGINEFISLLGSMALLAGIIYLVNEIKSWFVK